MPATSSRSLTPSGIPSSGLPLPSLIRCSAAAASASSTSRGRMATIALSSGCRRSIAATTSFIKSTGEALPRRSASQSSVRLAASRLVTRKSGCLAELVDAVDERVFLLFDLVELFLRAFRLRQIGRLEGLGDFLGGARRFCAHLVVFSREFL